MKKMRITTQEKWCADLHKYTGLSKGSEIEVYSLEELKNKMSEEEYKDCSEIMFSDEIIGFTKMKESYCSKNCNYIQVYDYDVEEV